MRLSCYITHLPCVLQICVVGGGAGGVETSLALNHRLQAERQQAGKLHQAKCRVTLFSKGHILQAHTPAARRKLLRLAKVQCSAWCSLHARYS